MPNYVIVIIGLAMPFVGTALGASMVIFAKNGIKPWLQKILLGFASGVMIAASIWSLLIPSLEAEVNGGIIPAIVGFAVGMGFLLLLDTIIPHLHINSDKPEGVKTRKVNRTSMMVFAVALHNVPEGIAVGVSFAGALTGNVGITLMGALALAIGIAIQNFPEGAIVSLPLRLEGHSRSKAFMIGSFTGIIEPIAALITILLTELMVPILPYLLSFAAGAMVYVVIEELIPQSQEGKHSNLATVGFMAGFIVMLLLVVLIN